MYHCWQSLHVVELDRVFNIANIDERAIATCPILNDVGSEDNCTFCFSQDEVIVVATMTTKHYFKDDLSERTFLHVFVSRRRPRFF